MPAAPEEPLSRRQVMADALARPRLRALALIFSCFKVAEMGAWIAVTTIAHDNGGIDEAARVVAAQLAPAALAAASVGALARRVGLRRVLCGGLFLQGASLLGIGVLLWADAPNLAVYALAVVGAVAVVTTRPTVATVMPLIVEGPNELTAANSIIGWLDGACVMIGPIITGVGFALAGLSAPFIVFAALTTVAGLTALRIAPHRTPSGDRSSPVDLGPYPADPTRGDPPATGRPSVGPVLVVLASYAFLLGALDLLFVIVAIDVTNGPLTRASWLNTAFGLGALVGGAASALLIGRRHLWPTVIGAGLGAAATIAVVGQPTRVGASAVAFAACGLCAAVLFVSSRTLLQRCCDLESLCRAFSLAEACEMAMLLIGALTVPLLVDVLDPALAPGGVALIVVVAVVATAPRLARMERLAQAPLERIAQLRAAELLGALPAPTLETLAREADVVEVPTGTAIITEGDPGDCFYVITDGSVVVRQAGVEVARLGVGDGFGELALLLDVPRTATVVALSTLRLLRIGRVPFLVAVTGQAPDERFVHG